MANNVEQIVVAPAGQSQALFAVGRDGLRQIARLNSWPPDYSACTSGDGWLASRGSQAAILVARFSVELGLADESRIEAPENVQLKAIAFAGNHLFAGGTEEFRRAGFGADFSERRPWIGWVDITESLEWTHIELDSAVFEFVNKGVDALVVSGGRLLAFDNIIEPLFALVIDLGEKTNRPTHVATLSLNVHSTYERIIDATVNDRFIATLSSGINHGVSGQYIAVFQPSSLENEVCLFAEHSGMLGEFPDKSDWRQIALADSMIYVAAGEAGLGVGDVVYEDGITYLQDFGRVDRVMAVDNVDNRVIISAENDGVWVTRMVSLSFSEIRAHQRTLFRTKYFELESLLAPHFEFRDGLTRVELLTNDEKVLMRYRTSKVAEIRAGRLLFTNPGGDRNAEAAGHEARLSIALTRAGVDYDLYSSNYLSISMDDYDGVQLARAIGYFIESLKES